MDTYKLRHYFNEIGLGLLADLELAEDLKEDDYLYLFVAYKRYPVKE